MRDIFYQNLEYNVVVWWQRREQFFFFFQNNLSMARSHFPLRSRRALWNFNRDSECRWDIQRLLDSELVTQFSNYYRTLYVPASVALCAIILPLMRFIANLCTEFFDVRGSDTPFRLPLRGLLRPSSLLLQNWRRDNA